MLTKKDINFLVDTFVTRTQFEQTIETLREEMITKNEYRKLFGMVESVFTEVKGMREEQSMHVGAHERQDEEISSLKKRVTKLENVTVISHKIQR